MEEPDLSGLDDAAYEFKKVFQGIRLRHDEVNRKYILEEIILLIAGYPYVQEKQHLSAY